MCSSKHLLKWAIAPILSLATTSGHAYFLESDVAFFSWTGVVSTGGQFTSTINGYVVCPDAGCGPDSGVFTDPPPADPECNVSNTPFCGATPATVDFSLTDIYATPTQRPPNQISLSGVSLIDNLNAGNNVNIGDEVVIGRLRYTNGQWFSGPDLGFGISTRLHDCNGASCVSVPSGAGYWEDILRLTVTPNTGTAAQNADRLCFVNNPQFGCFAVYEPGDTADPYGEVELRGRIGSLTPTGFGNVLSGGFLAPVPVPAAIWLLAGGLAALFGIRNRKLVG